MEKGNNTIGLLIGAFVCLFLGLALIGVVADQANAKTGLTNVEQTLTLVKGNGAATNGNNITYPYTVTGLDDAWMQDFGECSLDTLGSVDNILVYNSTGAEMMDNGACSDLDNEFYYVEGASTMLICNADNINRSTYATLRYQACPTEYVGGWASNILVLVPGFFALALLGCSIALFYSVAKLNGIL